MDIRRPATRSSFGGGKKVPARRLVGSVSRRLQHSSNVVALVMNFRITFPAGLQRRQADASDELDEARLRAQTVKRRA